jgi:N-acetylneuraminic acid mutarotase
MWQNLECTGASPTARSGAQAVALADCFYIFGGYTKKDGEYFNDLYRFDTSDHRWVKVNYRPTDTGVPEMRTDHTLIAHNDNLIVFGGYDGQHRFNDVHFYNLTDEVWRKFETPGAPEGRFGHSAIENKDRMIIFGGWNGHDTLNEVWSFSITRARWLKLETAGYISHRYRHSCVVFGNSMFVFGGVNKD